MAGFRDDFYCRVGRDYHEHMESSFIYGYVRREREQNLRLRIKEELFCLADTPLSKGRYTRFLVRALLTDWWKKPRWVRTPWKTWKMAASVRSL